MNPSLVICIGKSTWKQRCPKSSFPKNRGSPKKEFPLRIAGDVEAPRSCSVLQLLPRDVPITVLVLRSHGRPSQNHVAPFACGGSLAPYMQRWELGSLLAIFRISTVVNVSKAITKKARFRMSHNTGRKKSGTDSGCSNANSAFLLCCMSLARIQQGYQNKGDISFCSESQNVNRFAPQAQQKSHTFLLQGSKAQQWN